MTGANTRLPWSVDAMQADVGGNERSLYSTDLHGVRSQRQCHCAAVLPDGEQLLSDQAVSLLRERFDVVVLDQVPWDEHGPPCREQEHCTEIFQ